MSSMNDNLHFSTTAVCQPVDMDLDPSSKAMRFNTVFYHAYLFRYVDMCDTFFFIMRKKYRNVNALQVGVRLHLHTRGAPRCQKSVA